MGKILKFEDEGSHRHDIVGGKGANLGLMTHAGFQVPGGFNVTTDFYGEFLELTGVQATIAEILQTIDYDTASDVDQHTARIRELISSQDMPEQAAQEITRAYTELGDDLYVAVRSSGTAEDLEGASFAGLHDTYLDVRSAPDVVQAVQDCWASLWTSRAVSYRQARGFDHFEASMSVVVQTMVQSEVSGVMFTGNPLTTATDEIVINASWGLGEAVVQGIVSPDQYTVKIGDLRIKEKLIGHKTVQIIRDHEGKGAIETEIPADKQSVSSLSDQHIQQLAELGRRVMDYYQGMPQDIEWALWDDQLFLLQSRPITGVDFSWDSDVDSWQPIDEEDDTIWSRTLSDDMWTGAKTPLFFSFRAESWAVDYRDTSVPLLGKPEAGEFRMMKYWKGEAYSNVEYDKYYIASAPPQARPGMALKLPEFLQQEAVDAPFSYVDYVKMLGRAKVLFPRAGTPYGWMNTLEDYFANRIEEAGGDSNERVAQYSDEKLGRYIQQQISFENQYNVDLCWPGLFVYVRDIMTALYLIIEKWYDGDNEYAYPELIAGSQKVTHTVREHIDLYKIAHELRENPALREAFESHVDTPGEFFNVLPTLDGGDHAHELITEFLAESGHRGHADRDIFFDRYADNPAVLYRALEAHAKSDEDPMIREHANNQRRAEVRADVEANIRSKPFGSLKVEAFKWCLQYILDFQMWRDDERHFIDRNTYSLRNAWLEVNQRLRDRGILVGGEERDFYFLTQYELFDLLKGAPFTPLHRAKIEARKKNFDAYNTKNYAPPKFLQHNRPLSTGPALTVSADGTPILRGLPTSRGTITGTARVIKELSEIGRVNKGEILVANSTDPGWTPVFAVISGVIVETGGMLSHSSCLAREYGFPAAQVEGALQSIPDGATITLNGDTGEVIIGGAVEPGESLDQQDSGPVPVGVGAL